MGKVSAQAEGAWGYPAACKVIDELKQIGAESGVTVGGIWILFDLDQSVAVTEIVRRHGGKFCLYTGLQNATLKKVDRLNRARLIDHLEKSLKLSL
jgi:hypothetical protein